MSTMSAYNISPEMQMFLHSLLESNGITFSDETTKQRMVEELFVRVDKFLSIMIVSELDDAGNDEFLAMLAQNKPQEEIQAFLKNKIPDFEAKVKNTLADFRDIYLGQ